MITEEVVKFALEENLETIVDSMKYYVRQNLEKAYKEAIQDAKNILINIEQDIPNNDNNPE